MKPVHERINDEENFKPVKVDPHTPIWATSAHPNFQIPHQEINLLDYWRVFSKRKWQIIIVTFLSVFLAFGITKVMPKKFKAEVTILPITAAGSGGGGSGLASQIGAMSLFGGALGDLGKLGGGKTKELVNILKSNTLTEKIVVHFDLLKVFYANQYDPNTNTFFEKFMKPIPVLEDAVSVFKKKYSIIEEEKKSGLVKISVIMKDPQLAAQIANRMILELQDFIENNSLTVSKRNRIFLEEQLVKTRAKLIEAGKDLNQFYADNKISSVVPQIDVSAGSYALAPKAFEEFRNDLDNLNAEQGVVEEKKEQAIIRRVPGQVYLQYLNLNRELLAKTYALLMQQYEIAKIEEAKEDLAFQVIDKAKVKIRPSSPKLMLNLLIGFAGGFSIAIFLAFFREYIQKLKEQEAAK